MYLADSAVAQKVPSHRLSDESYRCDVTPEGPHIPKVKVKVKVHTFDIAVIRENLTPESTELWHALSTPWFISKGGPKNLIRLTKIAIRPCMLGKHTKHTSQLIASGKDYWKNRENQVKLDNVAITAVMPRAASRCARTRSHSLALPSARQNSFALARPPVVSHYLELARTHSHSR